MEQAGQLILRNTDAGIPDFDSQGDPTGTAGRAAPGNGNPTAFGKFNGVAEHVQQNLTQPDAVAALNNGL